MYLIIFTFVFISWVLVHGCNASKLVTEKVTIMAKCVKLIS